MGIVHTPQGELSERERTVLRCVVRDFIETASPIGSRFVSRKHEDVLGLSSASIRNIMSDLEEKGFISHPHTSAGRVPTDKGYRLYLDSLMEMEALSTSEQKEIRQNLEPMSADAEDRLLRESSRLIGKISRQLCVITAPYLSSGTFEKLELYQVLGKKLMVIISIKAELVRTIMLELEGEVPRDKLDDIGRFLNERLSGLTLKEIRETFQERVRDAQGEETGLIRLFIESVDKLFVLGPADKLHIGGTEDILTQPEFVHPKELRGVIELINNEEIIIHVLRKHEEHTNEVKVTIGKENEEEKLKPYSVITSPYSAGGAVGTLGVIGPKRMPYFRMIPLVDYVAKTISEMFTNA